MLKFTNPYAVDGKCHNSEPGTYGHECGKKAEWIGVNHESFASGFCDKCKRLGYEGSKIKVWHKHPQLTCV